jgi:methionyl aminopeptidase
MISIKSANEIEKMRAACSAAACVLADLMDHVVPGITTGELDDKARDLMVKLGVKSACYQYRTGNKRFPGYTCISVNNEVVHGVPSKKKKLEEGDNVSLDVCVMLEGFIGDTASTVAVGVIDFEMHRLLSVTKAAMEKGIEQARPGRRVGDISHTIQSFVEAEKMSIIREYCGHGVGRSMHEEPQIPNFGRPGTGALLEAGMTLAIEPMVALGKPDVRIASDGWTAVMRDKKSAAHFEHTVLITPLGPEILTIYPSNPCRVA